METWEKFVRPPYWATEQIMLFFYKKNKNKIAATEYWKQYFHQSCAFV